MKFFIKNLTVYIFLALAFSALTGCRTTNQTNSGNSTSTGTTETKKADYPPVPAAIADATYKLIDNGSYKIGDNKGKVILVNLWATWCGPCRQEMPHLIEMQEEFKDKNFEIVGLSIGDQEYGTPEPEADIKAFAEKMKLNYKLGTIQRKDYQELLKISKFEGIPQSFLINRDGQMAGVFTGGNLSVIAKMKDFTERAVNE